MKTTVEVNGYEIVIEEKDGLVTVSAMKEDEVVEEFELETEAGEEAGQDDEDVQDFDSFGQDEEEDFEDEDEFEGDEEEDEEDEEEFESEEDDNESKLESFQSFINKRK
jgi:hypothetical protein